MMALRNFLFAIIVCACLSCSHVPINDSSNETTETGSTNNWQGWAFKYDNGHIPTTHISNSHFISSTEYKKVYKNADYLNTDPFETNNSLFFNHTDLISLLHNSCRLDKNIFIARINPEKHAIRELNSIAQEWDRYIIGNTNSSASFVKYLDSELRQRDNLCWMKCLQFIGLYTERKKYTDDYIFNNAKNSGSLISGMLTGRTSPFTTGANTAHSVEELPASLTEILSGLGEESAWKVSNCEFENVILSLLEDSPVILGKSYIYNNERYSHAIVILGVVYSKNTNYYNSISEILGYYNLPGIPNHTLLKNTPFIYHNFLIFDPADASVACVDADKIMQSVDFVAIRGYLYDSHPLKPVQYYKN